MYLTLLFFFFFLPSRWDLRWWHQRPPTVGVWTLLLNTLSNPNSWGCCWPLRTGTGCFPGWRMFVRSATGQRCSLPLWTQSAFTYIQIVLIFWSFDLFVWQIYGRNKLKKILCDFCFSFLSKLEERVESDIMHFTVCDIIARHCQRFKMVYVPYLTNQSYQDATYQRLM